MTVAEDTPVVHLRIPIADAVEWEPWLERDLSKGGLGYDGGEEMGKYEVHDFFDVKPEQVLGVATSVLTKHRISRRVEQTGPDEITVEEGEVSWLRRLGPMEYPYDRAMRKAVGEILADPEMAAWWAQTGISQLLFQESHDNGENRWHISEEHGALFVGACVDLSVLDQVRPARGVTMAAARANLNRILERVSDYVGRPLPGGQLDTKG